MIYLKILSFQRIIILLFHILNNYSKMIDVSMILLLPHLKNLLKM